MATWHLSELRTALERRGWNIVEIKGDDHRISGTWQLRRSNDPRTVYLDFEGFDELKVLPLENSYACRVRGAADSVYFSRRGQSGSLSRERWGVERGYFVDAVNEQP